MSSPSSVDEEEILITDKKEQNDKGKGVSMVEPERAAPPNGEGYTNPKHLDISKSMEFAPPEDFEIDELVELNTLTGDITDFERARKLFFEDGVRRIDFILAWDVGGKAGDAEARQVFEENLMKEGLELEFDSRETSSVHYCKVHAPWEVLTRYAEIIKVRMPMKEVPEEIKDANLWEVMSGWMRIFMKPFELNPEQVPPVPKKFTCVFQRDKEYLFAIPKDRALFFSHATRTRIVDYILRRKRYSEDLSDTFAFGVKRLLANNIYKAAYPLHEGSWKPRTKPSMRRLLYSHWARWTNFYKLQPLDYIRTYFGEKIGMYFAWLGFYTWMLLPASAVGLAVFIYGCVTIYQNPVANEVCTLGQNLTMCPLCDKRCDYWVMSEGCSHIRASHLFDNPGTVFFAVFMSFWGTIFLEFWKREQSGIQFKWNLVNFEEEEEPPRPEYLARLANERKRMNKITGVDEPYLPFWRKRVPIFCFSTSIMFFLVFVGFAVVVGVIVYRMAVRTVLLLQDMDLIYKNASTLTSISAAVINLIIIFILNYIYTMVALKLTGKECLRTQSDYDRSLTFKLYTLQFVNYYTSIFYIAFIKGKFVGRPGSYNRLFGWRQEECPPGGCLTELCIQLAVIMVGKQLISNNIVEIVLPRIMKLIRICFGGVKKVDKKKLLPWEKDLVLQPLGPRGLFNEYLEMVLQFGFVTIFVAAFPLAPFFAFINNVMEIRSDANKFVTQLQRPMARRAQNIGMWYNVMYVISRLAVFTNALIIAFTSDFIPRLVYLIYYSPDGTVKGYVENSLSYFNVSDFHPDHRVHEPAAKYNSVTICRYRDDRLPPWDPNKYSYTTQFWHVMAARFIFIVVFENVVVLITSLIAKGIPDMPRKLREQVRREAYLTNEIILKTELEIARGEDGVLSESELSAIRRRARAIMDRIRHNPDQPEKLYPSVDEDESAV